MSDEFVLDKQFMWAVYDHYFDLYEDYKAGSNTKLLLGGLEILIRIETAHNKPGIVASLTGEYDRIRNKRGSK